MVGWLILIGLILLIAWTVRSESRVRRKAKEVLGDDYPDELKKTSTFGSFFFIMSLALLTIGVVGVICTIGRTLPELLDACFIGGVFFLPALVCWYIGFRHDRRKFEKFYEQRQRPNDP